MRVHENTDSKVRNQVKILYYNTDDDFAIKIKTSTDDEVILCKNYEGSNFKEMYSKIEKNEENYTSVSWLSSEDTLRIPNIKLKKSFEFSEIESKNYLYSDGTEHYIDKAIQNIEFTLNEGGGKVKSESVITDKNSLAICENIPKKLWFDSSFVMFLKEDSSTPYLALLVNDASILQ